MLSIKFRSLISAITLVFSLLMSNANAGPDSTTSHFMSTKATMLDIGLLRLDRLIKNYSNASFFSEGMTVQAPFYEWDDDTIMIEVYFTNYKKVPETVVTKYCKQAIEGIQSMGGVSQIGEYLYDDWSRYAGAFAHDGFSVTGQSELLKQLDKKFSISCVVLGDYRIQTKYTKKLLGQSISKIQF